MGHKQVELPFPVPIPWEKMEPDLQNKTQQIMAQMINQIIENNHREDNDERQAEPSNP